MSWYDAVGNLQTVAVRVFGEVDSSPTLFHPGGSGSFVIEGIFRAAGLAVDPNLAVEIRTERPELHVRRADVFAITGATTFSSSDEVTVRGVRYRVADHDPDGEGMELLFLTEA